MPFSGYLASTGYFSFFYIVLIGTFADLCGSLLGYYVGLLLEESVMLSFIRKYGKFILISEHDFIKARQWFFKYGSKIVLIGKFIPGIRTYISLPAGISEMNILKFSGFVVLGSLIWNTFLTFIGYYLGKNWQTFGAYFRKFEIAIIVLIVIAAVWYINHKLKFIKIRAKK